MLTAQIVKERLSDIDVKNVKIIKIDVDGHELNILKSGREFIKKQSPLIIMEFAPYALEENGNMSSVSVLDIFKRNIDKHQL